MEKTRTNKELTPEEINQIRLGDKLAFRKLYQNYAAALNTIALKIVISEDIASDVLQDGFVKIWKNFESFDSEKGRLFTWMANIIRNTAIDVLRKKNVKYEIQAHDKFVAIADRVNNTTFETDTLDVREKVNSLLPTHRDVIEMVYLSGYTHEETAKKLGIPLGTVKTRVRLAMQELKRIFGNEN